MAVGFFVGCAFTLSVLFTMEYYFNTQDYSTTACIKPQRALGIEPQTLERYERGEVHMEP